MPVGFGTSWQFIGGTDSASYRLYDRLRRRVNGGLVSFICGHLPSPVLGDAGRGAAAHLNVLEAGSGTAFASSLFAKRRGVSMAICLDIDIAALKEARRRDPDIVAVAGDLMRMPFRDDAFGVAFNSSTLEHLVDPQGAVREMQRVVCGNGRVFVGLPYSRGPLFFQPLIRGTRIGVWLGEVFSRSSLDSLLASAGLVPVKHRRYFWRFFIGAVAVKSDSRSVDRAGGVVSC